MLVIPFIFVTRVETLISHFLLSYFIQFRGIIAKAECKRALRQQQHPRKCGRQVAAEYTRTRADESERGNKRDELARQAIVYARTLVFHSAELLAVAKRIVTSRRRRRRGGGGRIRDDTQHEKLPRVCRRRERRSITSRRASLKSTDLAISFNPLFLGARNFRVISAKDQRGSRSNRAQIYLSKRKRVIKFLILITNKINNRNKENGFSRCNFLRVKYI